MNNQNNHENKIPFEGLFSTIWLNVNIWTGQARLNIDDIRLGVGGSLPPSHFASLGSKNLIDPESLRVFNRLKQKAARSILAHGVRFLGGYAIPKEKEIEVIDALQQIESEFISERNKFIHNLDNSIQKWMEENPEWASSIRSVDINPTKIEGRLNFEFATYSVAASTSEGRALLHNQVTGMADELIRETVQTAEKLYKNSFLGKDYVNSRTLPPLIALRDKIQGLSFLNGNFTNLVKLLNTAIDAYQNTINDGQLHQPYLGMVTSAILVLSDANKINDYGHDLAALMTQEVVSPQQPIPMEMVNADSPQDSIAGFFESANVVKEPAETNPVMSAEEYQDAHESLEGLEEELNEFLLNKPEEVIVESPEEVVETATELETVTEEPAIIAPNYEESALQSAIF